MKIHSKPALLLLALPLGAVLPLRAATEPNAQSPQVATTAKVTPGTILAAQIREIVATADLSDESKQRQIAAALRLAITTALTNVADTRTAANLVTELARAAAGAAPQFSDAVFRTVTAAVRDIPVLAKQAGLVEALREAITDAAEAAKTGGDAAGAEQEGRRGRGRDDQGEHEHHGDHDDVPVSPHH